MTDSLHTIEGRLEKFCLQCEEWWPADTEFFTADSKSKIGLSSLCRACQAECYRLKHPIVASSRPNFTGRNSDIVYDHKAGKTFQQIAEVHNITRQRAQQIYKCTVMKGDE